MSLEFTDEAEAKMGRRRAAGQGSVFRQILIKYSERTLPHHDFLRLLLALTGVEPFHVVVRSNIYSRCTALIRQLVGASHETQPRSVRILSPDI